MSRVAAEIIQALTAVLGKPHKPIVLHEPYFAGNEEKYVVDCIKTGWVSSVGAYVDAFERNLAEFTGAKHAVLVVNGTEALHVSLLLAGVKAGDEVLMPALSFIATANAVTYCGAIPHFVDVSEVTIGLDVLKLEAYLKDIAQKEAGFYVNKHTGRRLAAVVPMHTFGFPMDLEPLQALCARYHLPMIEDAAEALGSYYHKKHVGTMGLLGTLSFNGNKIVTTGGGGAIITNDSALAKHAKHLTTTAKKPHAWAFYHDEVGFNYRMPNLNAALGCAQLEQIESFLKNKRDLAERYQKAFKEAKHCRYLKEPASTQSNYWLNALRLNTDDREQRDACIEALHQAHFLCRPVWTCLSELPMYCDKPKADLSVAYALENSLINIPSSVVLGRVSL